MRVHLVERDPRISSMSVEGLLVSKLRREYVLAVPQLLIAADKAPVSLDDARFLEIPRENVQFFEVLA